MRVTSSGMPRAKKSRPFWSRAIRRAATSRIACSRSSWKARCAARSSALGPSSVGSGGKQQARLQVGEPGRHHQIVRRKFDPQSLRLVHENQILLGQLQHRDPAQVDLLGARQHQQQVKRALKAIDIDDQRFGRKPSPRRTPAVRPTSSGIGHAPRISAANSASSAVKISGIRRPAPGKRRLGARGLLGRRAGLRRRPPPASRQACRCNAGRHRNPPRAHAPPVRPACRTAPAWTDRRSSAGRQSRSRRGSRGSSSAEQVAGDASSKAREHDMRGHRHRQVGQAPGRRAKSVRRQHLGGFRDRAAGRDGCRAMARPCPGMCFTTGSTPPSRRPRATSRADLQPRSPHRCRSSGFSGTDGSASVATSTVGAQLPSMPTARSSAAMRRERRRIARAASAPAERAPCPAAAAIRASAARAAAAPDRPPDRRRSARRARPPSRRSPVRRRKLVGGLHIAGEQDEAPRVGLAKEGAFGWAQIGPETAEDAGPGRHHGRWVTGMQVAFSASRAEQNRRASASSSNPSARRRTKLRPPLCAVLKHQRLARRSGRRNGR